MFCFSIPSRNTLQVQNLISAQIITIIHFLSQHYINKEASTETLCTLYFVFPGWVSVNVIRQAACHKPNTLTSLLSVNVTWLIQSQARERWKRTHFIHLNMICITCIWAWGGVGCDNQCECPPAPSAPATARRPGPSAGRGSPGWATPPTHRSKPGRHAVAT